MQRWTGFLLTIVLGSTAWGQAFGQSGGLAGPHSPSIQVSGTAVVKVKPDRVVIRFGIETIDRNIGVAKKENRAVYDRAMAAIKACGLKQEAVQTDHLSIEPRYTGGYGQAKRELIGYATRVAFAVTLDDPAKIEDLTTKVLEAGVNRLHGVTFETRDYKKHREEARRMALLAAREKAEKMAATLGLEIGPATRIVEGGGGINPYPTWGWGRSGGMSQNVVSSVPAAPDNGPLALGKLSIRATVNVTFLLKSPPSR